MWLVHKASKPSAIATPGRAGISGRLWYQWKAEFAETWDEISEFLYRGPWLSDKNFKPTAAMLAFRKHAKIKGREGVAAATKLREQTIRRWRERYQNLLWFRRWLLRGEEPPRGVTIATADQVNRCRKAFDYVRHSHQTRNYGHNSRRNNNSDPRESPPDDGRADVPAETLDRGRRFGTFTADLQAIARWLRQGGVTTVAMESTGVYWVPLYDLLPSEGFEVLLVDPRQ